MADTTSRFITLAEPKALPGCCLTCRGATGPFIDAGFAIQFHGRVYICFKCLREMSRQLPTVVTDVDYVKAQSRKSGYEAGKNDERSDLARGIAVAIRDLGIGRAVMDVLTDIPADAGV